MSQGNIYKIDASGRALGRVASEAASALRGKTSPNFARNVNPQTRVQVINAKQMKLPSGKTYVSYSGYPGGLYKRDVKQVVEKHGVGEVLHRAVRRMLPNNKLRRNLLKQLTIND